jgi:hypothetical protein
MTAQTITDDYYEVKYIKQEMVMCRNDEGELANVLKFKIKTKKLKMLIYLSYITPLNVVKTVNEGNANLSFLVKNDTLLVGSCYNSTKSASVDDFNPDTDVINDKMLFVEYTKYILVYIKKL